MRSVDLATFLLNNFVIFTARLKDKTEGFFIQSNQVFSSKNIKITNKSKNPTLTDTADSLKHNFLCHFLQFFPESLLFDLPEPNLI